MSSDHARQTGPVKAPCPLCRGHGITYQLRRKPGVGTTVMTTVRMALCQVCDGTGRRPREESWGEDLQSRFAALLRRTER